MPDNNPKMQQAVNRPATNIDRLMQPISRMEGVRTGDISKDVGSTVKALTESQGEAAPIAAKHKVVTHGDKQEPASFHDGAENVKGKPMSDGMSWSQMYQGLKDFVKQPAKEAASVGQKKSNIDEYKEGTKPAPPEPAKQDIPNLTAHPDRLKNMPKPDKMHDGRESVMWGTRMHGGVMNVAPRMMHGGTQAVTWSPRMHDGAKNVPAILEEGERVVKKEDNKKLGGMSNHHLVRSALAFNKMKPGEQSDAEEAPAPMPAKSLKEMRIRKAKSGGHIIEHVHSEPSFHPNEEHVTKNNHELAQHVMDHMGDEEQAEGASAQGGE
jgi:hypothetical protein